MWPKEECWPDVVEQEGPEGRSVGSFRALRSLRALDLQPRWRGAVKQNFKQRSICTH